MAASLTVSQATMAPSPNLQTAKVATDALTLKELAELEEHIRHRLELKNPLLSLPPELRNRIYYLAAIDALKAHVHEKQPPALLTTCRQIREEFGSLYFSDAIMTFERLVDKDTSRWEDMTVQFMLEALFVLYYTPYSRSPQSAEFRQRFGIGNRTVRICDLARPFSSADKNGLLLGNMQDARRCVEQEYRPKYPDFSLGILVFNAACGVRSRLVWQTS